MTSSMDKRVRRLENPGGDRKPMAGLAEQLQQAIRRHKEDPEGCAREADESWVRMQEEFKAGRLHGLGLQLYQATARARAYDEERGRLLDHAIHTPSEPLGSPRRQGD